MHAERLERLARGHQIHPPLFFLANHSDGPLLVWSFLALKAHFLEGELGPRNEGYEAGGARRENFLLIAGFVVNNAAWSTGTDDISVEIIFSSTADEGRYQLGWRQFVRQLAFNSCPIAICLSRRSANAHLSRVSFSPYSECGAVLIPHY